MSVDDVVKRLSEKQRSQEDTRAKKLIAQYAGGSDYDSAYWLRHGQILTAEDVTREVEGVLVSWPELDDLKYS